MDELFIYDRNDVIIVAFVLFVLSSVHFISLSLPLSFSVFFIFFFFWLQLYFAFIRLLYACVFVSKLLKVPLVLLFRWISMYPLFSFFFRISLVFLGGKITSIHTYELSSTQTLNKWSENTTNEFSRRMEIPFVFHSFFLPICMSVSLSSPFFRGEKAWTKKEEEREKNRRNESKWMWNGNSESNVSSGAQSLENDRCMML